MLIAAIPELKAVAWAASVRAATLRSRLVTVGFSTFAQGLVLADGLHCLPAKLTPLSDGRSVVCVQEGKYHQVRRMLASRGCPVTYLRREAEGGLTLGDLPLGQTKELNIVEAEGLLRNIL